MATERVMNGLANFGGHMEQFFGAKKQANNPVTGSPAKARAKSSSAAGGDGMDTSVDPPLSKEQMTWVGDAVGSAFNAFGAHVDERFKMVEDANAEREKETKWLREQLEKIKAEMKEFCGNAGAQAGTAADTMNEIKNQIAALEKIHADAAAALPGPPGIPSGSVAGHQPHLAEHQPLLARPRTQGRSSGNDWLDDIIPENRRYARIGNLGWDAESDVLLPRAKEMLEKAGIPATDYDCMSAVRTKGSVVSLTFKEASKLQDARRQMRCIGHTYEGLNGAVWLDVEKSRRELAPARLIHKATDMITDLEAAREDKKPVEKIMNGKQIKVGGILAAWSFRGALQVSRFAEGRYSEEERQQVLAFAEG